MAIPIVDSHVHLWPEAHLPTIAWHGPGNPLGSQYSVDEYRTASKSVPRSPPKYRSSSSSFLRGFVYLEVDRISSSDDGPDGWRHVLDEVSYVTRIILGEPLSGEGHRSADRSLCLGMIPWAPMPAGSETVQRYVSLVRERTRMETVWKKVRGFRYLVQDKPAGTMLTAHFIDALKWLGRQKLVFDLGVDARQGGLWQLREALEMIQQACHGVDRDERVRFIINHMCKPNLRISYTGPDSVTSHPDFIEWKRLVSAMAAEPTAYMKLSGLFSELPALASFPEPDLNSILDRVFPWTDVIFNAFGPERVMFGSDWPVCNIGGGGNDVSWERWRQLVEALLDRHGLTREQQALVWGGTAVTAYGLDIQDS